MNIQDLTNHIKTINQGRNLYVSNKLSQLQPPQPTLNAIPPPKNS